MKSAAGPKGVSGPPIATIGYESDTQQGLIDRLKAAGVEVLIDVRAIAASRRPGFSKTILAASLADQGVDYVHLRPLGTPKAGREAARAGRTGEMRTMYAEYLEAEPQAQIALAEAVRIAGQRRAALLCYEAKAACCHRAIVAERLHEALGCEVIDL